MHLHHLSPTLCQCLGPTPFKDRPLSEILKLRQVEADAKSKEDRARARIDKIANQSAKAAFYVSGLIFAACGVLALFGNLTIWFGIPAALFGFFNLWAGFSGNAIERAVKRWIAKRLSHFIS